MTRAGFCPQNPRRGASPPRSYPPSHAQGKAQGTSATTGPDARWVGGKSPALKPWPGCFIYRSLSFLICKVGMRIAPIMQDCLFRINNK